MLLPGEPTLGLGPVVVRGREGILLPIAGTQLAVGYLSVNLGPLLAILLGLGDIVGRRRIRGGRYLVRIVVVDACLDAFLLGQARETVIVGMLRRTAMLTAIAAETLVWQIRELLCHHASNAPREQAVPPVARFRCYSARPRPDAASRPVTRLACWPRSGCSMDGLTSSSAAAIARPRALAIGGGKALPTCREADV